MNGKTFKFLFCFIICGCIVASWTKEAYADQRGSQAHIHIKGKIATADGQGVADVDLRLQSAAGAGGDVQVPFVTGLPSGAFLRAEATESGTGGAPCTYKTSANGEYHILLTIIPPPHTTQMPDVNTLSIDRSKMEWKKPGYYIRAK